LLLLGLLFEGLTIAIRRWISFPISLSFEVQVIVAVSCIIVCLAGMIWFNLSLNLIKVNLLDEKNKLITDGPFNYVRHPLYSTLLISIPPLVIIWFSDLLFFIPWVVMIILSHYVIFLEERGLVNIFGEDYDKYRRFVPALLPYKGAGGKLYREHCNESAPRSSIK
jgi:protein-S-isoprenylcysteine O-methyltransferase Ste14